MPVEAKPLFRPEVLRPLLASFRLPVDSSDRTLDAIFPITVEQVWQWNPAASSLGFTTSPSVPPSSALPRTVR